MAKKMMVLIVLVMFFGGCVHVEVDERHVETSVKGDEDSKMLRHVVLFSFKDSVTAEQVKQVETNFGRLAEEIDEIYDFEWGRNLNSNQMNKDLTHCFVVTFKSEEDLERYEIHPAHEKFKVETIPHLEDFLVMDFWQR